MYIPREIGSDKAFIPQQSNPNMVESRTTQELTLCGVGGGKRPSEKKLNRNEPNENGPNGDENHTDNLLTCIQQAVDSGLRRNSRPICLISGDYFSDSFVGKQLCTKRFRIYSPYSC